jgi:hypothetical protein
MPPGFPTAWSEFGYSRRAFRRAWNQPLSLVPKVARGAAFVRGIAPDDPVESVDRSHFASLGSLCQRRRGLLQSGIADAIDCAAILVDLKEHRILKTILFWKHVSLLVLEQDAKAAAGQSPQKS